MDKRAKVYWGMLLLVVGVIGVFVCSLLAFKFFNDFTAASHSLFDQYGNVWGKYNAKPTIKPVLLSGGISVVSIFLASAGWSMFKDGKTCPKCGSEWSWNEASRIDTPSGVTTTSGGYQNGYKQPDTVYEVGHRQALYKCSVCGFEEQINYKYKDAI